MAERKKKKSHSNLIQTGIGVLAALLAGLIVFMMYLVSGIQGTARVVNYAGLVRGKTQRIVKLEISGQPEDEMLRSVESFIRGLRYGDDELQLVRLDDPDFQNKMEELDNYFLLLKDEIYLVRSEGYAQTEIIPRSEEFFNICDQATGLAEAYSQRKASSLSQLEKYITADIAALMLLIGFELVKALRYAAMPPEHFVGRDGGDEFVAITRGLDREGMDACLAGVRKAMDAYSREHPDMPISYAVGYALAEDFDDADLRQLFNCADKNMYINKNHVKREEAAAEKQLDLSLLRRLNALGRSFADCLYCDVQQDTYRLIRASESCILAADGSYSGAVEQLVEEQVDRQDRTRVWRELQTQAVERHLAPETPEMELQYRLDGSGEAAFGRLTLLFVDRTQDGALYHFLLAYESLRDDHENPVSAKQQLTQYYEQLKQSVLENDSYVDALLETADAVYAVDLTHDVLERNFVKKGNDEGNAMFIDYPLPGAYSGYCAQYAQDVTPETIESYRLTDTPDKLLRRFRSGSKQFSVEYCVRHQGRNLWVQKTVLMTESTVYDAQAGAEHTLVHGMILLRDTTAFHRREQQEHDRLQAAFDQVSTANQAKTEFLSRMSHDIRTPINGVMGMLAMIRKNRDDPAKVDACLEKIQISSEHLLSLINDVLDMSKLESGHIQLENVAFDLGELLNKVRALEDGLIDGTGLTFLSRVRETPPAHPWVMGSPLHLRQILINLFSNAVKYNKPGGRIETDLRELSCDGQRVVYEFRIQDTGIGMSEEFVQHSLFEPFTQEKSDARTSYQGTGLGMAIVKELLTRMGGSVQVESALGEGTVFTVQLPFDLAQPPAEAKPAAAAPQRSLHGLRALLVEDNQLNMEIAEFFLTDLRLTVEKAWNGQEAVDAFAASAPGHFDVIFMDVMMPVLDGLEATRRIRALDRPDAGTVPILAMTANAFAEDAARSRQAGMNEHLSKPLDEEALRAALLRCL